MSEPVSGASEVTLAQEQTDVPELPTRRRRWSWPVRLLVAANTAWLIFVVLQVTVSGRLSLWLLFAMMPPIAFLAVPVLLALATLPMLIQRRLPVVAARVVAASVVAAIGLGAGPSGLNLHALAGARPVLPGSITVFSWNTEYWYGNDDPARFYRFLSAQHADIYLLQEHFVGVDDSAELSRQFPGYQMVARGDLLTLSRFPIVATPRVGPDRDTPAAAAPMEVYQAAKVLRTDLKVGDRPLSVYNVHMPIPLSLSLTGLLGRLGNHDAARKRQMRGLLADLATNPHPVLVAGDFNMSPAMGDLRGLRGRLVDAGRAGRSLYPASWHASRLPLWRLDWAFTGPDSQAERYDLLDPEGLSDHRAQRVTVALSG